MPKPVKELISNFWSTFKAAEAARKEIKNHYYNGVKKALSERKLHEASRLVSECPCFAAKAACCDLIRRYSSSSGETITIETPRCKGDTYGNNPFPITVG